MSLTPERISAAYAIALEACDGDPERARKFLLAGMELAALKTRARAAEGLGDPREAAAITRFLRPRLAAYVHAN